MPKTKRKTASRVGTFQKFRELDAMSFTPSDSPAQGQETRSIKAIQRYLNNPQNFVIPQPHMSSGHLLDLMYACEWLRVEDLVTPAFVRAFTKHVATHYSR